MVSDTELSEHDISMKEDEVICISDGNSDLDVTM